MTFGTGEESTKLQIRRSIRVAGHATGTWFLDWKLNCVRFPRLYTSSDVCIEIDPNAVSQRQMDQPSSTVVAAAITGIVAISASSLTLLLQQRSERKKWTREQTKMAYSNALKALSRATIVPTGIDTERLRQWFDILSEVRESLVVLQIYCLEGQGRVSHRSKTLFDAIQQNDFVVLATTAANISNIEGNPDAMVLIGVGKIRLEVLATIEEVTRSARHDLKRILLP